MEEFLAEEDRRDRLARIHAQIKEAGIRSLSTSDQLFYAFECGFGCVACRQNKVTEVMVVHHKKGE